MEAWSTRRLLRGNRLHGIRRLRKRCLLDMHVYGEKITNKLINMERSLSAQGGEYASWGKEESINELEYPFY